MTPDFINGIFETVGAGFVFRDVLQLCHDRSIRGVYWPSRGFFGAWGFYNLFYYPWLGQLFSFAGGMTLTVMTLVWVVLAVRWRGN